MAKHVIEMLIEINKEPEKIKQYKDVNTLKLVLKHAFTKEGKFILPDGIPPFREANEPFTMTPTTLTYEASRLYVLCRMDLTPLKRETIFVNMLEQMHPDEAKVLLAVKDQKLDKLYPKITRELLIAEGILEADKVSAPETMVEKVVSTVKRGAGRPAGSKNRPKNALL